MGKQTFVPAQKCLILRDKNSVSIEILFKDEYEAIRYTDEALDAVKKVAAGKLKDAVLEIPLVPKHTSIAEYS